jgi:hypothetical protein
MRLLLIVLAVLNLLALAAGQGWLGSSQTRGEPERITNQLNPERILIAAAARAASPPLGTKAGRDGAGTGPQAEPAQPDTGAASAATAPAQSPATPLPGGAVAAANAVPDVCLAYGGMTQQQADALAQQALAERGETRLEHSQERHPSGWWVRLPPAASREAAGRKVNELRALGVNDYFVLQEPGPNQFAISLGLFRTEAAAQQHLAALQSKRIRGAGITPRHSIVHRVEIRGQSAVLEALADRLATQVPAALRDQCAP